MSEPSNGDVGGLRSRCVRGGMVLAAAAVFERAVRLAVNMILARLLAPDQFGLMALVVAANGFLEILTEVGVRQSIIQNKKGDSSEYLSVAWWFSAGRGIVLSIASFLAAPYLASFYGEPLLTPLLRVAFLTLFLHGVTNPGLYVLEKNLQFGRYVWIMQGSALGGTLLCLGTALWAPNVWALVVGLVAQAALSCAASFLFSPIKIGLRFDRDAWGELVRFSKGMAGLPILTYLFMQADVFTLGKIRDRDTLGLYSMAMTLALAWTMVFNSVARPMVLPVLADAQACLGKVRDRLLRMTRLLVLLGLPCVICQVVFGRAILTVVYGPRYGQVTVAFGLLSCYALLSTLASLIASTYIALGRPDLHRLFTFVRLIVLGATLYPAILWFGASGAAGTRVICMVLAGVVQQYNLSRLIDLPVRRYLAATLEGLVLSAVLVLPALALRAVLGKPFHQLLAAAGLCSLAWGYVLWRKRGSVRKLLPGRGAAIAPEP